MLENIENRQSEIEGERKRKMKQLEERVRTLELRNKREGEVAGQREEAKGGEAGVNGENERLRERLREVERRVEGEERMKRKRKIIIKEVKSGSGTGEEEVVNLRRDIGAQLWVEEVRNLVGKREGKGSILLVNVGSEEKRKEVLEKKMLRGGSDGEREQARENREIR